MASLTPESRRAEVTASAFNDGMINGAMMFVPSLGGLWLAMRNPRFRQLTNAQSRTALTIMPPLFTFGLTSEQQLTHRMHEVASESEHNMEVRACRLSSRGVVRCLAIGIAWHRSNLFATQFLLCCIKLNWSIVSF